MALLIQRVSGSHRNGYFLPDLAGVGVSHNTFVWNPQLDPKAGMLRLVLGLGTRAVNRVEDDYPRIVALDAPLTRPLAGLDDIRKYSQNHVDLLDIRDNTLKTVPLQKLFNQGLEIKTDLVAVRDAELTGRARALGDNQEYWLLTFEKLLTDTPFTQIMQKMLKTLENYYQYPVDIEFTVNFTQDQGLVINLLQCRPLQTKGRQARVQIPAHIDSQKVLFQCEQYFMGGSITQNLRKIIYVEPEAYLQLALSQKYDVARLVGKLNRQITDKEAEPTILFGPGRWGTTTPSLGVPVGFHEINQIAVLVEMAYEGGNLMPELSFGTHFFQDLVETDIFYVALFPQKTGVIFNKDRLLEMPNRLAALVPESNKYAHVVKVCEIGQQNLRIMSDLVSQKLVCFFT
jgi:hypothetical protein